jgi:hypothetical protein
MRYHKINLLLIIISLLLIVNSSLTFGALTDNLFSYYSFEGNYEDNTTNNRDITNFGSTLNSSGKKGYSINCDGSNDYVLIPITYNIMPGRNFTYSFWGKIDIWLTPNNKNVFFGFVDLGTSNGFVIGRIDTVNKPEFPMHDGLTGTYWNTASLTEITTPLTATAWYMYTITHDGGTNVNNIYVNGIFNKTFTSGLRTDLDESYLCAYWKASGNYGAVILDEFATWNRTITESEITALYNSGTGLSYSEVISYASVDTAPPKVTFKEQLPNSIVFRNQFGGSANITYNITDETDVNNATAFLYYSINLTGNKAGEQLINSYTNGTADRGYLNTKVSINKTSNYTFSLFDNDLFYALYNYNETKMEDSQKYFYDCNQTKCIYWNEFFNFSNRNPFNILELNVRNTGTNTQPLQIGVCNERVLNPLVSANCTQIFNNVVLPVNHTHANGKSNHSTVSFTFDSTNGKINNLWINNTIYPYVYANNLPPKRWEIAYINVPSRVNSTMVYELSNNTIKDLSYTWDMHIHQNASILQYYACANDTLNNFNCSEVRKVTISQSDSIEPDAPIFTNPNSTSILFENPLNNLTYISFIRGLSPSNTPLDVCKIDILDSGLLYLNVLNSSIPYPIVETYWKNSANYTEIYLNLTCCDNKGLCSNSISESFSLYYYDIGVNATSGTGTTININTDLTSINISFQMLVFVLFMVMVTIIIIVLSLKLSPFFYILFVYPLFEIMIYLAYYDNFLEFKRVSLIGSALCICGIVLLTVVAVIYKHVLNEREEKTRNKKKGFYDKYNFYE